MITSRVTAEKVETTSDAKNIEVSISEVAYSVSINRGTLPRILLLDFDFFFEAVDGKNLIDRCTDTPPRIADELSGKLKITLRQR
jgi:hypothetical protein